MPCDLLRFLGCGSVRESVHPIKQREEGNSVTFVVGKDALRAAVLLVPLVNRFLCLKRSLQASGSLYFARAGEGVGVLPQGADLQPLASAPADVQLLEYFSSLTLV